MKKLPLSFVPLMIMIFVLPYGCRNTGPSQVALNAAPEEGPASPEKEIVEAVKSTNAICGNGLLDVGEECDDGNLISADGCSAACTREIVSSIEEETAEGAIDVPEENCFNKTWKKHYFVGGSGTGIYAKRAIATDHCSYIIAGEKDVFDTSNKLFLAKIDASGNVLWSKFYGREGYSHSVSDLFFDNAGNGILVSNNGTMGGADKHATIMRFSQDGTLNKIVRIGDPAHIDGYYRVNSHLLTDDGRILLFGAYSTNASEGRRALFMILSSDLALLASLGLPIPASPPPNFREFIAGVQGEEALFIIGNLGNNNFSVPMILKISDLSSTYSLVASLADPEGDKLTVSSVVPTSDGFFVLGETNMSTDLDLFILKINPAGEMILSGTYGGNRDERLANIVRTGANEFAVLSTSKSFNAGTDDDAFLLKIDGSGSLLEAKTYGGSRRDYVGHLLASPDGGLLLTGMSPSYRVEAEGDLELIKLNAALNFGGEGDDFLRTVTDTTVINATAPEGFSVLDGGELSLTSHEVSLSNLDISLYSSGELSLTAY